jgi:hypothetical protein
MGSRPRRAGELHRQLSVAAPIGCEFT